MGTGFRPYIEICKIDEGLSPEGKRSGAESKSSPCIVRFVSKIPLGHGAGLVFETASFSS
jgi:hypothetical protein